MAKAKTPSFVVTIEMQTNDSVIKAIEDRLEIARVIYNSCLGELLKREKQMKRTKEYRRMKRCLRAISQKLEYFEGKREKEKENFYKNEKDKAFKELFSFQEAQGLTEYAMHEFANPIRKHFGSRLNVNIAQKIATRAWNAFHKKLKREAKRVNFIKRGEILSFEGKTNTTGWIYRNKHIVFNGQEIGLKINEKDLYIQESLSAIENEVEFRYKDKNGQFMTAPCKVKYVHIVKRVIRGKNRYFAQMTVQGFPPPKRYKDGSFKYVLGNGRKELVDYLNEVFTLNAINKGIKKYRFIEYKGKMAQPNADGGSLLEWEKTKGKLIYKRKDIRLYQYSVPYSNPVQYEKHKVTFVNVKGKWKINAIDAVR